METIRILEGNKIDHKMISGAIQLDRISYEDMYQLSEDTCFDYYEKNQDIYIMAVDDESGQVVGYINFSPVKSAIYEQLKSGNVIDTVITGEDVLPYQDGTHYLGYFSSIVVHPEYRQHGVATQMLICWADFVCRMAKNRNIYFNEIVADAISDVGAHLLSEIGFSLVKASKHESKIMVMNLFSYDIIPSKINTKILDIYRESKRKAETNDAV